MSKKIERKDRHFKFETLQLHVSDLQMQVTFTDVLQTRLKMYSRKESQRLKAVLRHLQ